MTAWYHAACAFSALKRARKSTKKIDSEDDLEGFDDINEEDQELIRGLINGEAPEEKKEEKKATRKRKAAAPKKETKAKKAKVAATVADGQRTYLECDSASGGKFWEITIDGASYTTRWGKLGANGSSKTKDFADEAACQKDAAKQIAAKKKKDYVEAASDAKQEESEPESEASASESESSEDEKQESGDVTYLECDSASGGKFWECTVSGNTVTTRWGKVGTNGQTKSKTLANAAAAQKDATKQIAAKQKKGYEAP
jgi:predicted DNA-binding WGR domain protein